MYKTKVRAMEDHFTGLKSASAKPIIVKGFETTIVTELPLNEGDGNKFTVPADPSVQRIQFGNCEIGRGWESVHSEYFEQEVDPVTKRPIFSDLTYPDGCEQFDKDKWSRGDNCFAVTRRGEVVILEQSMIAETSAGNFNRFGLVYRNDPTRPVEPYKWTLDGNQQNNVAILHFSFWDLFMVRVEPIYFFHTKPVPPRTLRPLLFYTNSIVPISVWDRDKKQRKKHSVTRVNEVTVLLDNEKLVTNSQLLMHYESRSGHPIAEGYL